MTLPNPTQARNADPSSGIDELVAAANATMRELLDRCVPGDPMRPDLQQVHQTMQQLAALTRGLDAPGQPAPARATTLDLNTVVQQMKASLQRLLGPFISLETALYSPGAWVAANRGHVEQVALGLVINAREALPLGGIICLATERRTLAEDRAYRIGTLPRGTWAVLEVRDNGTGIDEQTVQQLFEPSWRGFAFDSSLSLSTVSRIVRDAGGRMVLDTSRSRGTVLAACFPESSPPRARQPATGTASAVLVVDDDEWIRMSAARTLRRAGYGVLEAEHPDGALELLADVAGSCVRLMLVDVTLAFSGPLPLGERLRQDRPDVELLLTGRPHAPDVANQRPVLEKPFSADDLLKAVRERLLN